MKKRILTVICAVMIAVSLAACGESGGSDAEKTSSAQSVNEAELSSAAEAAFAKAFEADKTYDVDAMAEVEYTVNFSKTLDKAKLVEQAKQAKAVLDEEELEEYIGRLKDVKYRIIESKALSQEELKTRVVELSANYRDTDQITAIIKMKYTFDSDIDTTVADERDVEMICVGEKWYCYMGDDMWKQ